MFFFNGQALAQARVAHGFSRRMLARHAGRFMGRRLSTWSVRAYERGLHEPTFVTAMAFAMVLSVSLRDFLVEEEGGPRYYDSKRKAYRPKCEGRRDDDSHDERVEERGEEEVDG
jgi:transcriptional regulator with XRE-family HTH domain